MTGRHRPRTDVVRRRSTGTGPARGAGNGRVADDTDRGEELPPSLEVFLDRPEWHQQAACPGVGPDLFIAKRGGNRPAKALGLLRDLHSEVRVPRLRGCRASDAGSLGRDKGAGPAGHEAGRGVRHGRSFWSQKRGHRLPMPPGRGGTTHSPGPHNATVSRDFRVLVALPNTSQLEFESRSGHLPDLGGRASCAGRREVGAFERAASRAAGESPVHWPRREGSLGQAQVPPGAPRQENPHPESRTRGAVVSLWIRCNHNGSTIHNTPSRERCVQARACRHITSASPTGPPERTTEPQGFVAPVLGETRVLIQPPERREGSER